MTCPVYGRKVLMHLCIKWCSGASLGRREIKTTPHWHGRPKNLQVMAKNAANTDINYHSNDFNFHSWAIYARDSFCLPPISCSISNPTDNCELDEERKNWESFFVNHKSGNFFRPRNYLLSEFSKWFSTLFFCAESKWSSVIVTEVGCGYGCSMYPLLRDMPRLTTYMATDYSATALTILRENAAFDDSRCRTVTWDVTLPPNITETALQLSNAILCIFALSAVRPEQHISAFCNMSSVLKPGGVILFRDYGVHDMTMYRHKIRHSENLFERSDKTLAYYFSVEYLKQIANTAGLSVIELEYATIEMRNRKLTKCMKRVFVHAVFRKDNND